MTAPTTSPRLVARALLVFCVAAILSVAFMIVPAATAYLVCQRVSQMLGLTVVIAVVGALVGFGAAYVLDAATSGMMAFSFGVLFVLVFAGERIAAAWRPRRPV